MWRQPGCTGDNGMQVACVTTGFRGIQNRTIEAVWTSIGFHFIVMAQRHLEESLCEVFGLG